MTETAEWKRERTLKDYNQKKDLRCYELKLTVDSAKFAVMRIPGIFTVL